MADDSESWLSSWRAQPLAELTERLRRLGVDDAESWARSELAEDIPQTARYLVLRALWDNLDGTREALLAELQSTLGFDDEALRRVEPIVASSLFCLGFTIAFVLDEPDGPRDDDGNPIYVDPDGPRWRLVEIAPDGRLTGREVGGLHESMMQTVPGGEDNAHERGWF